MYETFFRFTSRPFVAAPIVSSYFASESAESARQTLTRAIDRAEGPGLIVGPAGVGKTLLCRLLAARFQPTFQVAMLSSTRILTRKALLQNILFELNRPYRNMEEGELRLALLDHLQPNDDCPNGILLIIDEAHALPLRLLEELRMITNLVRDGQPRVRLVMAGGAKLEEKFASPKLASFNQRIAARCYLEPFGRDDTIDYVLSRLAAAGGNADGIFDDGALRAIYQATDGIPRLINQVCDHALVMAFAGGRQQIDAPGVEEAWADLQQLPGPWQDTGAVEAAEATIEFGELDDEPAAIEFESGRVEDDGSELYAVASDTVFGFESEEYASCEETGRLPEPQVEATDAPVFCADPFGDGFDEEEVVIAKATIHSSGIFANRTRVVSREGRELAASILPAVQETPTEDWVEVSCEDDEPITSSTESKTVEIETEPAPPIVEPVAVTESEDLLEEDDWVSQAAYGAQMFEYTAFEPNSAANLALEALCDVNIALGDLENEYEAPEEPTVKLMDHLVDSNDEVEDDRSIILIENDESTHPLPTPEGSVHRVEYQTLFSQLRQG